MTKENLCEECGSDIAQAAEQSQQVRQAEMSRMTREMIAAIPQYSEESVLFIFRAFMAARLAKFKSGDSVTNVTAAELLEALRLLAVERFGSSAREQLRAWGITCCEDFGEIVIAIAAHGWLGKSFEYKKEDFANGYDFESAFPGE